jgi:hypothetical protein
LLLTIITTLLLKTLLHFSATSFIMVNWQWEYCLKSWGKLKYLKAHLLSCQHKKAAVACEFSSLFLIIKNWERACVMCDEGRQWVGESKSQEGVLSPGIKVITKGAGRRSPS